MVHANTQILAEQITNSALLRKQQKTALLSALPTMDELQITDLLAICQTEPVIWKQITAIAINKKAAEADTTFFKQLQVVLTEAKKQLYIAHEKAEKGNESEEIEVFFDDDQK